jgi:LPS sulfotransferase NodH
MFLYQNQFSEKYHFPKVENASKFVVIASTPRSGSHMLGHILYHSGRFGYPLEYLNSANFKEWKRIFNTRDADSTLQEIIRHRTSPNGVFSIKMHYSHLGNLDGFNSLLELFPGVRFVVLHRADLVGQAVSLAKASQTGVWISGQRQQGEARYDYGRIKDALFQVILEGSKWMALLESQGTEYLNVCYEMVCADPKRIVNDISKWLGLPEADETKHEPRTQKQFDSRNAEWGSKFLEEFERDMDQAAWYTKVFRRLSRYRLWQKKEPAPEDQQGGDLRLRRVSDQDHASDVPKNEKG